LVINAESGAAKAAALAAIVVTDGERARRNALFLTLAIIVPLVSSPVASLAALMGFVHFSATSG
jgi:hypothetical protein